MAEEHQIAVNLVADDQGAVLHAQFAHPAQLVGGPDAAHRVVGVAQDEQGRAALERLLKGLEVHGVVAVFLLQGNGQALAAPVFHRVEELAVNGGGEQNLVAGLGEFPHKGAQRRHHAQRIQAQRRVRLPAVALFLPLANRFKIGVRAAGVAEDALPVARVDGVQNGLGGHQIHVGDPHGDQVPAAEAGLHLVVLGGEIVPPVDGAVEIVFHSVVSFCVGSGRCAARLLLLML